MRIDTLTPEQVALMPVVRDEWIAHGLSTAPTDWAGAEAGMRRAYELGGKPPPKVVIHCTSPLALVLTDAVLRDPKFRDSVRDSVWDSVGASVRDSVWDSVRDSVRDSVWDSVWASVWASVRDSVWDSVWASVRDSVGASVWASVRASVRDSVRDSVWASVRDSVWASVWASVRDSVWDSVWASVRDSVGASVWASVRDSVRDSVGASVWASVNIAVNHSWDSNWLAFYNFFGRIGLDLGKIDGLMQLHQSAGWWIARENIALIAERPTHLHRDDDGRLHSEVESAIGWSDGWGVYSVHGVRVPADIITAPEKITNERISAETNAEIRRVMIDRYGVARYVQEAGTLLDDGVDETGNPLRLYERKVPDDESIVMLQMTNTTPDADGTRRLYLRRVPPQIPTAIEARNWVAGLPPGSRIDVQT